MVINVPNESWPLFWRSWTLGSISGTVFKAVQRLDSWYWVVQVLSWKFPSKETVHCTYIIFFWNKKDIKWPKQKGVIKIIIYWTNVQFVTEQMYMFSEWSFLRVLCTVLFDGSIVWISEDQIHPLEKGSIWGPNVRLYVDNRARFLRFIGSSSLLSLHNGAFGRGSPRSFHFPV